MAKINREVWTGLGIAIWHLIWLQGYRLPSTIWPFSLYLLNLLTIILLILPTVSIIKKRPTKKTIIFWIFTYLYLIIPSITLLTFIFLQP